MTLGFDIPGPSLNVSEEIHSSKYREKGETFREAMNRVAYALKDNDEHFHQFRSIIMGMQFMPAGRIQVAVGSTRRVTPYNCLAGETEILTAEYGSVPIASVAGNEVHVLDGNSQWVKVEVKCFGVQDLYKVNLLKGGQSKDVYATANHDWVVKGKKVKTSQLTIYKRIDSICPPKKVDPYDPSFIKGVVHGLVYGDGTRNGDEGYFIRICSDHKEQAVWFDELELPVSYPPSYNGDPVYYLYGKNVWASFKELPLGVDHAYLLGFFRGWFAADGCVSKQPEAVLTTHEEGYRYLKQYGPIVGFKVSGRSKLPDFTTYGKRSRDTFNVRLDLDCFTAEDCLLEKHRQRLRHYKPKQLTWSPKVDKKSTRKEPVYCVTVPTTQSFVLGNGVLSGNCFVAQEIADNFTGEHGIMETAAKAAETMRMGGGIGYDFSTLRPRGDLIKTLQSRASGPISFMSIFDSVCRTIASAGHRRGAQMGILRVDHPDIEEFIREKQSHKHMPMLWELVLNMQEGPHKQEAMRELQKSNKLTGFNVSIAITDEFMHAVKQDNQFNLKWNNVVYKTVNARTLWEQIMRSTWDWAEPGVIFIDTVNNMNNLWYCERIAATNPCGEQPLPPNGACLLGSWNLVKFVKPAPGKKKGFIFDYEELDSTIPSVIRAMDNVVDRANYPLEAQQKEAESKRRMGLGVTGLANAIEALGFKYGSADFLRTQAKIQERITVGCYRASVELAKEKGAFPLFSKDCYPQGKFITRLPADLQEQIYKHGIRNSHLTSIAPTGTISLAADNVSSGVEPVFSYEYDRDIIDFDGPRTEKVVDYGLRVFGTKGKRTHECSIEDHLNVLLTAQRYVDSAVSKTCNVSPSMGWDDFKDVYMKAWEGGAKGCTTFNSGGMRTGVLNTSEDAQTVCYIDPETGKKECE